MIVMRLLDLGSLRLYSQDLPKVAATRRQVGKR